MHFIVLSRHKGLLGYWACPWVFSLVGTLPIEGLGLGWALVGLLLPTFGLHFHIQRLIKSFFTVQRKEKKNSSRYSN